MSDIEKGHGKIQLNEVLFINVSRSSQARITTGSKLWLRDNQPLSHLGIARYAFTAVANSRAKVTLAWTDPAASPLADVALVNDLDLVSNDLFAYMICMCHVQLSERCRI